MPILDLKQLDYYKAIAGESSLQSGQWYVNYGKRHAFSVSSDFDTVNVPENKIVVSPVDRIISLINKFSDKLNISLENTRIVDNEDGTESVELVLGDRVVTIIIDESGSMTWNDNNNHRHDIAEELLEKINDNYPGFVTYNLIKYGSMYVNVVFFALLDVSNEEINDVNSLAAMYFADDESNFVGVRVVRNEDHYPTSYVDGEILEEGYISSIFSEGLEINKTYYYTIYTYDQNFKFSEGVSIKVVPRNNILPRGISIFNTWVDALESGKGNVFIGSGVSKDSDVVGLWHFDERKESRLYDFSASQADLEFNKEPTWLGIDFVPAGESGVWFNKENTVATYEDTLGKLAFTFPKSGETTNEISIMMWIYPHSLDAGVRYPLVVRENGSDLNYYLSILGDGLEFNNGGSKYYINNILIANTWQHVALTYDSVLREVKVYINSILMEDPSNILSPANLASATVTDMIFQVGGDRSAAGWKPYFGKITELSIHSKVRDQFYIQSQVQQKTKVDIDVEGEDDPETYYTGISGDNGDRIIILNYEVPEDYNFIGGEILIIRNEKHIPNWEEDGDIIKRHSPVEPGRYYITDVYDFTHDESYYYKIYSKNTLGNVSYFSDSTSLQIDVSASPDTYLPALNGNLVGPSAPSTGDIITPGNKKSFLRWKTNGSLDSRITRVRVYYSQVDYPTTFNRVSNELVFSGLITDEKFVHREVPNNTRLYYTIVNVDKYGRYSSSVINTSVICSSDADESIMPIMDVEGLYYEQVNDQAVSVSWDLPVKHPENIDAYFDQTVYLYAAISDDLGQPVPEETLIRLVIKPSIKKETGIDDVFTTGEPITFVDSEAYDFVVSSISNGIIRATLKMSSSASIMSQIKEATFEIQVKSYIPKNDSDSDPGSSVPDASSVDSSGVLGKYIEIIEELTGGSTPAPDVSDNIFEYISMPIIVTFTNPWEIELVSRDDQYVYEKCYYYETDPIANKENLKEDTKAFNGVYMKSSTPFMARAKLRYKGESISSGSINFAVWDADMNLCTCAGQEEEKCDYVGNKIQRSQSVLLVDEVLPVVSGTEDQETEEGTIQVPISYVDIPVPAPDSPQAVLLFAKGFHAGFSSLKQLYIVFSSILKIDINVNAPRTNNSDIAEQQSVAYIIDPDHPYDLSFNSYPIDDSIVQWGITPRYREKFLSLFVIEQLDLIRRELYSLDNVPLSNGIYSYTRSGTSRNVFIGPIPGENAFIIETHEVSATIVYDGLTAVARNEMLIAHQSQELEMFGARFLMEMEHNYKFSYSNKLWMDGEDYVKLYISRNPAIAVDRTDGGSFRTADVFRECAEDEGAPLLELSSFGQVVKIDSGSDSVEIIHGEVIEIIDPYTGNMELQIGKEGFIEKREAFVQLNDESVSDITTVYIRANGFCPNCNCLPDPECLTASVLGPTPINCSHLGLTICSLPGGSIFLRGTTTLFVNGEPLELRGGGDMYDGIPPCPICFREPLLIRTIWTKIDGIENEEVELSYLNYDSVVDVRVEVSFAGESVPEGTPVYINIESFGGVIGEAKLFQASSNVVFTEIGEDGRSYADIRIFANRFTAERIEEKLEIYTIYDKLDKVERKQSVFYQLATIPREEGEITSSSSGEIAAIENSVYSRTAERYNIVTNQWDTVSSMENARGDSFVGTVDNKIYVMGGMRSNSKDIRSISSVNERYNMSLDVWHTLEPMPTPRYGGMTVVSGDNIYTIGGIKVGPDNNFEVSRDVEVYNVLTDIWLTLPSMPENYGIAFGTAQYIEVSDGSNIDDYIYILCGINSIYTYSDRVQINTYNDMVLRYSITGEEWEFSKVSPNDEGLIKYQRESPLSIIRDNEEIIIFNGAWPYSKELFIYPLSEVISVSLNVKMEEYIELNDATKYFDNLPVSKYYSGIVEYTVSALDPSIENREYFVMGGKLDEKVGNEISPIPLDIVETIDVNTDVFSYENSLDVYDNPSKPMLVSMLTAKYGHGLAFGYGVDGSTESPFVYVLGGYISGLEENSVIINWENLINSETGLQKEVRCRLDGRQSVTLPISIKHNGRYIDEDVNIIVRGFLKFDESREEAPGSETENYLTNKTVVYPVLFTTDEIVVRNGRATLTLLPRSEDIMQDTESVQRRAENYSLITDEEVEEGFIREDEAISERYSEDVTVIQIETGEIREPYKISVEVTIVDKVLQGQTVDRGVVSPETTYDDIGSRDITQQASNLIVDYYSDIDWIPSIDSLLESNNGNISDAIKELRDLKNSVAFGASTIYDAIVTGADMLSDNTIDEKRKLIYLLTDNDANLSINSVDDAIRHVNEIDGDKKVPLISGNLAIVKPITLSVRANISDTESLNKMAFWTGGQSITLVSEDYLDDVVTTFYSEAVGALGYGTFEFTADLGELVSLESIIATFDIPDSRSNGTWTVSFSDDGYKFIPMNKTYSSDGSSVPFTDKYVRYIKFNVILLTGFSELPVDEYNYVVPPALISIEITYNRSKKVYLYLNSKDQNTAPSQMTVSVNANDIDSDQIKAGLSKSDSHNWQDFQSVSQPSVDQNGKIFVPIRFRDDVNAVEKEPLIKIDRFALRAFYGSWDLDSSVVVYKNDEILSSSKYKLYPREGLVILSSVLPSTYTEKDYTISILNANRYKLGLEIVNKSSTDQLEIYGIGYLYTTSDKLVPPISKEPPEAQDVVLTPDIANLYNPIEIAYTYFDINYDIEDIGKRQIRWYINETYIEYLNDLTKWNDISNVEDPLYSHAFSFTSSDLNAGETILDRARLNRESILKVGDTVRCTVRVSDGDLYSSLTDSNIIRVLESQPVATQVTVVGINYDNSETSRLSAGITAKVKFDFYSDTGVNNSEIIWWVNGEIFKRGRLGELNEAEIPYETIVPGELGLETTQNLGLKMGNEVYVQVAPQSTTVGDIVTSEIKVVNNTLPTANNVIINPTQVNKNQDLVLTWDFYDFEMQALTDNDSSFQSNKTSVKWYRKSPGSIEWVLVHDSSDSLLEDFVLPGYENKINNSKSRDQQGVSILSSTATRVGEMWRCEIIPNDSIDDGPTQSSLIVTITSASN